MHALYVGCIAHNGCKHQGCIFVQVLHELTAVLHILQFQQPLAEVGLQAVRCPHTTRSPMHSGLCT